jgi:hypothetical protein
MIDNYEYQRKLEERSCNQSKKIMELTAELQSKNAEIEIFKKALEFYKIEEAKQRVIDYIKTL